MNVSNASTPAQRTAAPTDPPAASPAAPVGRPGRFISAARVFTVLTTVSRVFGMVRDSVFAAAFGRSDVADAFSMGFRIPNLFRRLFGDGALSSALIPVLMEYESSPDPRQREVGLYLMRAVITLTFMLLAAITIVAEVGLWTFWRVRGGDTRTWLVVSLTALMLPYVILVCLVAALSAILNVRGRFAEGAASPIILNVCQIVATAAVVPFINRPNEQRIFVVAASVLIGGLIQLLIMIRALRIRGWGLKLVPDWRHPAVRRVFWLMAPMIVPLAVVQINTMVDQWIAFYFIRPEGGGAAYHWLGLTIPRFLDEGAVVTIDYASRLYELPLGIFSVAIATAIFPALSRHSVQDDMPGLADTLRRGIELSLLLAIPATVGLILMREDLVAAILQYGKFDLRSTEIVASTMTCFALGLAAFSTQQLLIRAFYSLKQVRKPVKIAVWMVAFNFPLNIVLLLITRSIWGMALSTTICAYVQSMWLLVVLRRMMGPMGGHRIARSLAITLIASAVMAAGIVFIAHFTRAGFPDTLAAAGNHVHTFRLIAARAARLLPPVIGGAAIFFLVARLLKSDALRELISREA